MCDEKVNSVCDESGVSARNKRYSRKNPVGRRWVFTINNYTENDEILLSIFGNDDMCRYLVYGREVGEEGTPHLQGYMELVNTRRFAWMKNQLGKRAHVEIARGTRDQARDYCIKDGDYEEFGKFETEQGARNDCATVVALLKKKRKLYEVVSEVPQAIRWTHGLKDFATSFIQQSPAWRELEVSVFWGKTGTGKTRKAMTMSDSLFKLDDAKDLWFDGYTGEDCLLIDDFYGWIKFGFLLKLLDGYPLRLPVKGAFVWAHWTKVVITSNQNWMFWYKNKDETVLAALERRINVIEHFE